MNSSPLIEGPGDLLALLAEKGNRSYPGEPVTQLEHALQTADLARRAGARAELVVAALLHDIGHLVVDPVHEADDRHEDLGANLLAQVFGPAVAEPVRLHVAAKRFLVATSPNYAQRLSEDSLRSLALQGGPMDTREREAFICVAAARDALQLRTWDDLAKDPAATRYSLAAFVPFISAVM